MLSEKKKLEIANALKSKGALNHCERCDSPNFEVVADGYIRHEFHQDHKLEYSKRPHVPTAAIACQNCGNLNFFALEILLSIGLE